jgi:lipopolysaccharide/colanic/teichoic acid biosynthesis glycosyltransferase
MITKWEDLPKNMQNEDVKKYYDILKSKRNSLVLKRIFDFSMAIIILTIFIPFFILISVAIKLDSKGSIIFRQIRVTQYGKKFKIFKFRTMVNNANTIGSQVTSKNDTRITGVGKVLRKIRLDEIPQLFNIISGDMTFVGTRPEVLEYVDRYSDEMLATLLLPAGVTSKASIEYKNEEKLLENAIDAELTYIKEVLPKKMKHNLESIEDFSFLSDIKILLKTIIAVSIK